MIRYFHLIFIAYLFTPVWSQAAVPTNTPVPLDCIPNPPATPCICPAVIDYVCGCDLQTYNNACEAGCAGVRVLADGPCGGIPLFTATPTPSPSPTPTLTPIASITPWITPTLGCVPATPSPWCGCIALYDPVCGCDGRTYGNACNASCVGVGIVHDGPCGSTPTVTPTPSPIQYARQEELIVRRGVYPNPFENEAKIFVSLRVAARLNLTVYDVAGEIIYTEEFDRDAGPQLLIWPGANRHGGRVATGVYLVRVSAAGVDGSNGEFWEHLAAAR